MSESLESYRESYQRPFDIPYDIWWDYKPGAQVRRGQWVIDNCPEVSLGELASQLVMQPSDIKQLNIGGEEQWAK